MSNLALISPEIKEILNDPHKVDLLKEIFMDMHVFDMSVLCEDLEPSENAEIVTALGFPKGIEFFEQFKIKQQTEIFRHFSKEWMADVLEEMAPDERTNFIRALPQERVEDILPLVAQAERNDIKRLAHFDEDTAGGILTTEYAFLSPDITVKEAMERLKLQAFNRETIYYVYVIDPEKKLLGFVSLKDLLVAHSDKIIRDIMQVNVIHVNVHADKEEVARKISQYDFLAIPVVDDLKRLVGIVTVDDVMDVVMEEVTEDIYKYGAAGTPIDYLNASPWHIARQRVMWLSILVAVGLVSGWVMQLYEFQLQSVVALAFFIPLLCGSGGNAGTQSSTVVIRGLATGEIKLKNLGNVFIKEGLTGVLMGCVMGVFAAIRAVFVNRDPLLGVTVGLTMVITVMLATTLGALLPLIFKKFKLDPALMSGPFISSIVDVVSIFIYLQLASMIFA